MAAVAPAVPRPQSLLEEDDFTAWKRRLTAAKNDRRKREYLWQQCLAFAAGKQWHEWDRANRRFYLPPQKKGEERYTVDELTQYRMTVLGELCMDDDRPEVLFREDDVAGEEDYAALANKAIAYGWEAEWDADRTFVDVKRASIDLGTAAVRGRWDQTLGPPKVSPLPFVQGKPLLQPKAIYDHMAQAELSNSRVDLRAIHEGRICLDVGTPFNLLVPAGLTREWKFPWEAWVETVHIDAVQERYPKYAADLKPDAIEDVNQISDAPDATGLDAAGRSEPVEDHVFLYTCYERPCAKYLKGRVIVFAGQSMRPVDIIDELPCRGYDGTYRSGIHYFHYIRLTDRFWSRGLLELGKEAQRAINTQRSRIATTIARGQPFILAEKGSIPERTGTPVEVIPIRKGTSQPIISSGVQVGPWMQAEIEALREDLQRSTGVRDVSLGENPTNVGNYSQLALLREQDGRKLDTIVSEFKNGTAGVVADLLPLIREHWPSDKMYALAGAGTGTLETFQWDASKLPDFFQVTIPKGSAKPRSQAAQLKVVDDLALFSINSQQPLPVSWVKESYEAGRPVELPQTERHDQLDKALLENQVLEQGGTPPAAYYDPHPLHVEVHRALQARADAMNDEAMSLRCEQHIQVHRQLAQANAQMAVQAQGQLPAPPGAGPPQGPAPTPGPGPAPPAGG